MPLVSREFSGAMGSSKYRDWISEMSGRERVRYLGKSADLVIISFRSMVFVRFDKPPSVFLTCGKKKRLCATLISLNHDFAVVKRARKLFLRIRKIAAANRSRDFSRNINFPGYFAGGMFQVAAAEITPKANEQEDSVRRPEIGSRMQSRGAENPVGGGVEKRERALNYVVFKCWKSAELF